MKENGSMEERTFDLTVPVTRLFRTMWLTYAVILIFLGIANIKDNPFLGALQLVLGLITVPFMGLLHRINKYIVTVSDANLEIDRGLFNRRRVPWESISEIGIQLMKLEFVLAKGRNIKIDFTALSYNDNQIIKPQIIEVVTAFAEAKGIPVQDGRGA